MLIYVLSSGSCGNCTFIRSGNTRILVDAGLAGSTVRRGLEAIGESADAIDAILVTHDHRDHTLGAGILSRRHRMRVYATDGTFRAAERITGHIPSACRRVFESGSGIVFDGVAVETVATPHDGADPVGFVFDDGQHRFGVFTDIGVPFDRLKETMPTLDGMMLETNYDTRMLEEGSYPYYLKKRITGGRGHLSNDAAVQLLAEIGSGRLRTVFLSHLSEENNHPDRVYEALREGLDEERFARYRFILTRRGLPVDPVILEEREAWQRA
jgi:phosphoribosyl 1,2-cyclic phosphodiesterase